MRDADYSDRYQQHFTLGSDISTRDLDGIRKTFSGLMKILYPHGEATTEEIEEILRFAVEGRKRVKDQILRIDSTMTEVKFGYLDKAGEWHAVTTLEEDEYPTYYHQRREDSEISDSSEGKTTEPEAPVGPPVDTTPTSRRGRRFGVPPRRPVTAESAPCAGSVPLAETGDIVPNPSDKEGR